LLILVKAIHEHGQPFLRRRRLPLLVNLLRFLRSILFALCAAFALYTASVYLRGDGSAKHVQPDAEAEAGQQLWQEKNCQSCHQLYGLGGYLGPDLTNVAAKGRPYMRVFIRNGTARMPDFHLNAAEVDQLLAFLSWVDASGKARVPDSAVHWTGSYRLSNNREP
jgi:nitric oxide reductase subunit C